VSLLNSSLLDNPPQLVLRAMFRSFFWPALPAIWFLNKDPKVWLNGARPPPKVRLRVQKKSPKFGKIAVSTSELANF
jgi:hypothetical protein